MSAFPNVKFLTSAHQPRQFSPDAGAEVAVARRSNAGKSSAINAIVQRKGLAKTSKTPGATRLVNFFELEAGRRLVDLPGYGFAAVPGEMRQHWGALIQSYFAERRSLRGVIVVMDVRHPLQPFDQQMLDWALAATMPVHILLTKADKLKKGPATSTLLKVRARLEPHRELVSVQLFSALKHSGHEQLLAVLNNWLTDTGVLDEEKETTNE